MFWQFCASLYCSWSKSLLWFANRALKHGSARSKYILVPLFALFSTPARYIRFGVRYWFCNGEFSLVRQLQPYSVVLGLNGLLLLKGGLMQIILRFRCFLLVLSLVFAFDMKTKGSINPLFFNASKYNDAVFWKSSMLDDRSDSLLLIDSVVYEQLSSNNSGRVRITLSANFLYFLYFHLRSELISG